MTDLPDPLVLPDVDCTDLDGFMLNVERLMASELVALSTHEVVGAALFLWCRAWKQRPAASLPDDDRVLAAYAKLPLARFKKLRSEILRGFIKCSDGRLYHKVLAEEAVRAFGFKASARRRREADAKRLQEWRAAQRRSPDDTPPETPPETRFNGADETRFVAEGQDRTGQDRIEHHERTSPTTKQERGFQVFDDVRSFVATYADAELAVLALEFDGLDVPAALAELAEWAIAKGIPPPERKSAIYGGLKTRHAKLALGKRLTEAPKPVAVSDNLVRLIDRQRRPA